MLKPFTAQALYHAVRDAITRSASLLESAEHEIAEAHARLSRLAAALEASRTTRGEALDLVKAARELRRADPATHTSLSGGDSGSRFQDEERQPHGNL
jgi:FixJ family two-component response regulator